MPRQSQIIIIGLVALVYLTLLNNSALANYDTDTWVCQGKRIKSYLNWREMQEKCVPIHKGFCRYMCMLEKAGVLDDHFELEEETAQQVIAHSFEPDIHEDILAVVKRCVKLTNALDGKTMFCFGNMAFLHCLNTGVTELCGVDYDRYLFNPELVPIPLPPRPPPQPIIIQAPSTKKPKGSGLFFGIF